MAGCEVDGPYQRAVYSSSTSFHLPEPALRCNAPEADTRIIWSHTIHCVSNLGLNTLISSADTDTIFIGLTQTLLADTVYVKISAIGKPARFLSMHKLQHALLSDPDLSTIAEDKRTQTIQSMFVLTGCDFISFSGKGKVTFF